MRKLLTVSIATLALPLAACSQETQDSAAKTADAAAQDTAKNLDDAGKVLEQGAAEAAREVSVGAAALENKLRDGDRPVTKAAEPAAVVQPPLESPDQQQELEEEHQHD